MSSYFQNPFDMNKQHLLYSQGTLDDKEQDELRSILSKSKSPIFEKTHLEQEKLIRLPDKLVDEEIFFEENEKEIIYHMGNNQKEIIVKDNIWCVILECTEAGISLSEENKFWLIFHKDLSENSLRIPVNTNIKGHKYLWEYFRKLKEFNWQNVKRGATSEAENKNFICYVDNEILLKYQEAQAAKEQSQQIAGEQQQESTQNNSENQQSK